MEKTSYFTLGCKNLTVGTDHKPLISIIQSTDLGDIKTPRQQRLKERIMRWNLTVTYVPGKHLRGTDALSRYGIRSHNDAMVNNVAWGENPQTWLRKKRGTSQHTLLSYSCWQIRSATQVNGKNMASLL